MRKLLLSFFSLLTGLGFSNTLSAQPDTLVISECYISGIPGRGMMEITNMGKNLVDLSKYFVTSSTNGSDLATGVSGYIRLAGMLPPGGTYLIVGNQKSAILSTPEPNDSLDQTPSYYRSSEYDLMLPLYDSGIPGNNALRTFEGDDAIAICYDTDGDGIFNLALGDLIVDMVGLLAADGGARFVYPDVAGVTDATVNHTLIRKFSVKLPNNGNFKAGLGVSSEDSEWIVVPFDPLRTGDFFTTVKSHGNTFMWNLSSTTVTIEDNRIIIPWGIRRDSLYMEFNYGDNMAWYLHWGNDTLESVITQTADTFYVYLAGDAVTVNKLAVLQSSPSVDMNLVFPRFDRNASNQLFLRYQVSDDFALDTIYNIPFGTRVDTLLTYLEKAPAATWNIEFVDGVVRADLKTGDKLIVTAENSSVKEYYLLLNDYIPSSNALLGAIFIYGDTLYGFKQNQFDYTEFIEPDTDFPAISAKPVSLNAKVRIERPTSIRGTREDRTAKIYVTAVDDTTVSIYSVTFEIMKMNETFQAEPFFSQIMNGSAWGKGFEIFNPGNTAIPMGDYLIVNSNALTLQTIVSATNNIPFKMRPGYTIDSTRMGVGIYFNERPYPFITELDPGKTLVFGRGNPPTYTGNPFRALCDYMDTNGDLAAAFSKFGFVDGSRIGFFGEAYSFLLLRIDNDSIFNGLKPAGNAADYTVVDIFGAQGAGNNRTIEGTVVGANSNLSLERKRGIWKGNPENHGSFGTSEPGSGEWDVMPFMDLIGTHPYDPYTGFISTVSSIPYKVSLDFGPDQTIGLVPPGTSVDAFIANIIPNGDDAALKVSNADGSVEKTGTEVLVAGDILTVVSGTGDNTTIYTLGIQAPSQNAMLTSTVYTVSATDTVGQVSAIPALTTIEDLLANITVPAGAVLHVVDVLNQQVGTEKVLYDTLVVVKTMVSDIVKLEVVAEDGTTKILYNLVVTVVDPYITSDFYLVHQDRYLVDMFQANTLVSTFLSRVVASTGSTVTVVDNLGNVRSPEGIMYKDDKLMVSDGPNTTVYNLKDMFDAYSTDATLLDLKVNGVSMEGFDPAVSSYVVVLNQSEGIPPLPLVSADANYRSSLLTLTQAVNLQGTQVERTAVVRVIAEDGTTELTYTVQFDLNVGTDKMEEKLLKIYSEGKNIHIRSSNPEINDHVEVYNVAGRKVLSRKIYTSFERIQITDPAGLYIVKVKSGNKTVIEKLILR